MWTGMRGASFLCSVYVYFYESFSNQILFLSFCFLLVKGIWTFHSVNSVDAPLQRKFNIRRQGCPLKKERARTCVHVGRFRQEHVEQCRVVYVDTIVCFSL